MTKSGLSEQTQRSILQIIAQYAARNLACGVQEIYAGLHPGRLYDPRCSSLRVTLSWIVRHGKIRRQRHGRYSFFYPARTREGQTR